MQDQRSVEAYWMATMMEQMVAVLRGKSLEAMEVEDESPSPPASLGRRASTQQQQLTWKYYMK
jgi:hypothetical protein